jgi:murein DD-endopeptidase MepM/ murein hydrolase activator NlpD
MTIKPVADGHISSEYGPRMIQLPGQSKPQENFHCGIDIGSPASNPAPRIVCPLKGVIYMAGFSKSFGNRVWIHLTDGEYKGWYLVLAHMASLNPDLKSGEIIEEGTFLGIMGSTGLSLARHTHCELRTNPSDPEDEKHTKNPVVIRQLYA